MRLIDAVGLMVRIPYEEINARMAIANAPTVEAELVRHGHWIERERSYADVYRYECSECGFSDEHNETREVPYCWHCGAKMDGDSNTTQHKFNALEALDEAIEDDT